MTDGLELAPTEALQGATCMAYFFRDLAGMLGCHLFVMLCLFVRCCRAGDQTELVFEEVEDDYKFPVDWVRLASRIFKSRIQMKVYKNVLRQIMRKVCTLLDATKLDLSML